MACADGSLATVSVFGPLVVLLLFMLLLLLLLFSQGGSFCFGDSSVLALIPFLRRGSARRRCRAHPRSDSPSCQIGHDNAFRALRTRGEHRRGSCPPPPAHHQVFVDPADRARFSQPECASSGRKANSAHGPIGGTDGIGHHRPAAGAVKVEGHSHGEQRQGGPAEAAVSREAREEEESAEESETSEEVQGGVQEAGDDCDGDEAKGTVVGEGECAIWRYGGCLGGGGGGVYCFGGVSRGIEGADMSGGMELRGGNS